jgi:hypothetical protein
MTEGRQTADLHSTYTLIAYPFLFVFFSVKISVQEALRGFNTANTTRPKDRSTRQKDMLAGV